MKRLLFLLIISTPLWAQNTFEVFFNNLSTLEAEFVQRNYDPEGRLLNKTTGVISLKRPNQLYWHTHQPNEQIIIINDGFFWLYDVDLEQVSKQSTDKLSASPLYWLIEKGVPNEGFLIKQEDTVEWYQTTHQSAQFDSVLFAFNNKRLTTLQLVNKHNTVIIDFVSGQVNQAIDDTLFTLNIPDGVDVIE